MPNVLGIRWAHSFLMASTTSKFLAVLEYSRCRPVLDDRFSAPSPEQIRVWG